MKIGSLPDTVSQLCFSPSSRLLGGSCWDNTLHIWRSDDNFQTVKELSVIKNTGNDAILRCCFDESDCCYFGTALGEIKFVKSGEKTSKSVGKHERNCAVTGLKWNSKNSILVTASTDRMCKIWDQRSGKCVTSFPLPGKCIDLDCEGDVIMILVPEKTRRIQRIDIRNQSVSHIESKQIEGSQMTCISVTPDGKGFVSGNNYGSVEAQLDEGKYTNLWHSFRDETKKELYTVNCISVSHLSKGCIAGGANGKLMMFNLGDFSRPPSEEIVTEKGITSVTLHPGMKGLYAYSTGYDWSQGIDGDKKEQSEIFLGNITNQFD